MNPILLHYARGSCAADWLWMCRALEAAEDFAPLGIGPLSPDSPMRSAGDRAPVGAAADEVRQLQALPIATGPVATAYHSGEGRHFVSEAIGATP